MKGEIWDTLKDVAIYVALAAVLISIAIAAYMSAQGLTAQDAISSIFRIFGGSS